MSFSRSYNADLELRGNSRTFLYDNTFVQGFLLQQFLRAQMISAIDVALRRID
jgi:hypothetical protein